MNTNYQHPERPCIKVTRINGRGYGDRGCAAKGFPYGSRLALTVSDMTKNRKSKA